VDEEEGTVNLEVSEGVVLRVARAAVARVISTPEAEAGAEDEVAEVDDETDHETDANVNPIIERKD
jgi:hypothetical protein